MRIRWCTVHSSVVIMPPDDQDDFYLCEASNRTGDRTPCNVVEAEITWR